MWSFNRLRDCSSIETENILWKGPLSWPGFKDNNKLNSIPNVEGIYLFTFEYKDGYILYTVGITMHTCYVQCPVEVTNYGKILYMSFLFATLASKIVEFSKKNPNR